MEIKTRLEKIRGVEVTDKEVNEIISENRKLYIIIIFLTIVIFVVWVHQYIQPNQNIKTDSKGKIISITRPETNQDPLVVEGRVIAQKDKYHYNKKKNIVVEPYLIDNNVSAENEMKGKTLWEGKIDNLTAEINYDLGEKQIKIPDVLEDGTKVYFREEKANRLFIVILGGILLCMAVYKERYNKIRKEEEECRKAVKLALPEFTSKLVFLMEGGMVFNAAFEKIANQGYKNKTNAYFYNQLDLLKQRALENNGSIVLELEDFARRTKVVEFIRIASIVGEIGRHGSQMLPQLGREGENLFVERKRWAEERAKVAETKLSLPLVINLGILVVVTLAPTFLEI